MCCCTCSRCLRCCGRLRGAPCRHGSMEGGVWVSVVGKQGVPGLGGGWAGQGCVDSTLQRLVARSTCCSRCLRRCVRLRGAPCQHGSMEGGVWLSLFGKQGVPAMGGEWAGQGCAETTRRRLGAGGICCTCCSSCLRCCEFLRCPVACRHVYIEGGECVR